MPLSASLDTGTGVMSITFDQTLVPGPLDPFSWFATADVGAGPRLFGFDGAPAAAGAVVSGDIMDVGASAGVDRVTYTADEGDVLGLVGELEAPAFADFPMSVVP